MSASVSGIVKLAAAFKDADWLIPAYISIGYLLRLGEKIESASPNDKRRVLERELVLLYDARYLSRMLLGLYVKIKFVRDFKTQISDSIEASFSGLDNAAVATMIPVLEGVVRKIAVAAQRDVGSGTQKLIGEFDRVLALENDSPNRLEEKVIMLQAIRDYFADRILISTYYYSGIDELNRHGILHGIFERYGTKFNFLRLITILELLCYIISHLH